MLSTALNRSLLQAARSSGRTAVVRSMTTVDAVDPMEVFDQIDTNGDGVLSKEEFKDAVEKMHYVSESFMICEVNLYPHHILICAYIYF